MGNKKINQLADGITEELTEELFEFAEFDEEEAQRAGYSNYSYWRSTWQVFIQNRVALFCLILVSLLVVFT